MLTQRLKVLHDDNNTFLDHSDFAIDYTRDFFSLELVAAEDYIYVGDDKPINNFFVEMNVANTNACELTVEYFTTAWTEVSNFFDRSQGFTRSGHLTWDKTLTESEVNAGTGHQKNSVNGIEKYWVRLKPSADFSIGTIVAGLNIVFSDDVDLKEEYYEITQYLPENQASFIHSHVAARNEIIQSVRNNAKIRADIRVDNMQELNAFDLHNFEQVRQASKYLTLYKLFFNMSNTVEDSMYLRAQEYHKLYKNALNLFFIEIDLDRDGVKEEDTKEVNTFYSGRMIRR